MHTQVSQKTMKSTVTLANESSEMLPELNVETINVKYMLKQTLEEQELSEHILFFEPLGLLDAVEHMKNEVAMLTLDNLVLQGYLQQNDPKLLIGLDERITKLLHTSGSTTTATSSLTKRPSLRSGTSTKHSVVDFVSEHRILEYKVNSKTKSAIVERMLKAREVQVKEIEKTTTKEIKARNAKIKEAEFRIKESIELKNNFELHFLRDEADLIFLDTATEHQLQEKFLKFMIDWLKTARTLVGRMRLTISSLENACIRDHADVLHKSDLKAIVTEVDFEQLRVKQSLMLQDYDEKMALMAGVKMTTGTTLYNMNKEKASVHNIEQQIKLADQRAKDVKRSINDLKKDIRVFQKHSAQARIQVDQMIAKLREYEAPTVAAYMEKKGEEAYLRRAIKSLTRKIDLARMDLSNKRKKLRHKGTI